MDPDFAAYKLLSTRDKRLLRRMRKLPAWEKKKLQGLALWRAGWSAAAAARKVGMKPSTLQRLTSMDREGRQDVQELVKPLAVEIALESGRQTLEALHEGQVKPTQLPVVFGIATDKIERLGRMATQAEQSPLGQLMEMLHAGGKVTVEGPTEKGAPQTERLEIEVNP